MELLKLELPIFVYRQARLSSSKRMTNHKILIGVCSWSYDLFLISIPVIISLEWLKRESLKFV